jgi:enoyl-[acyl-carrier-protein] reductase (NADH)
MKIDLSEKTAIVTGSKVANLVVYVASPLPSATTGTALRVDGGVVESIA